MGRLSNGLCQKGGLQRCQNFLGVLNRLHGRPGLLDLTVGTDEKRHPMGALIFPPQEGLLPPNPIGLDDLLILVRHQRKRQLVLLDKLVVGLGRISANAEHHHPLLLERAKLVAEGAGFFSAPRRVVPGIEVQDDMLAPEVGKGHLPATAQQAGQPVAGVKYLPLEEKKYELAAGAGEKQFVYRSTDSLSVLMGRTLLQMGLVTGGLR